MKCGIYQIVHFSGIRYVGESTRIEERWADHRRLLRRGAHCYSELQAAWDADGEDAFRFEVLEEMPLRSTAAERRRREDLWRFMHRDRLFKRGTGRERKSKNPQVPVWEWSGPPFICRRMHLGPPRGMPERRVVKYSGRRDHIRLEAIYAEERAERADAEADQSRECASPAQPALRAAQRWQFPATSVPPSRQNTRAALSGFDRRKGMDRRRT